MSSFTQQQHNKSWWQLTGQRTASQGTLIFCEQWNFYFLTWKGRKYHWITDMQDTGHPGKHLGTLQVVSFLVKGIFLARKTPPMCFVQPYAPHDIMATKAMVSSGRAHPQAYCVKFRSQLDRRFLRYSNFCITPLLRFLQSDHYQTCT